MSVPTIEQIAWTAGFVDGEGSIDIYTYNNIGQCQHRLVVSVYNTDEQSLVYLNDVWGGSYGGSNQRDRPNEKVVWRWSLSGRRAGEFLVAILPFLVIKGEQAKIALEFVSLFEGGSARCTPENKEKRVELAQQLKLAKTA